ncbi:hypothetical protein BRARA_C04119 [Brassica rapa]|uniref:Uncharacterized protein n=1 Tax=Brassica campestris TaxID=3711 RepID=A0A398AAE5_BRACM|nr:hypothetical protein BRARA_C04119 [Brassica rapa]
MNSPRVTIAVFLAAIGKKEIIISFKCKQKSECLTNIACQACVDCRCDNGKCRCHGFKEEIANPTVSSLGS